MVIGSGPIVIGQAAEFDYAGAQACRMLKKEGVNVVLINPNPATIMTDRSLADEIYLEPLTAETVKRIILKEKPDSLLAGLGGQTGLTLASKLAHEGFLQNHNVRLIGTNAEAIEKAEDRKLFKETMEEIGEPVIPSHIANTSDEALEAADRIGYPVIIRPAFTLGGAGGGIAYNETELDTVATTGLNASPINQILVEKYIYGWKEIEFETMRDNAGNAIAVCSMENFDPVGIHTGDSIVAAPALTLSDKELQMLRSASMNIISALNIVGGCNCQFALDPHSQKYAVIEVNPRVSRSSALASKATGYPIAKVTTLIALGYNLDEITNDITGKTCACFEPALDYVVVKFPKWPFDKFSGASRKLGTQMKATGEVMAIAHSFEAALMKAIRGAEIKLDTLNAPAESLISVEDRLHIANDKRLFTVFEALKSGITVEVIHKITKIDPWFINKLKKLADFETELGRGLSAELYEKGKHLGYTDAALERISGEKIAVHRDAVYKKVDTCAAEFDAETPYFYSSYDKVCESRTFKKSGKPVIMVLGSGPIRIGQGIEFDYSSVRCVKTLKESGYEVVIVNNNPETVSTDYDTADRLYFEPLCPEDVMNVIKAENPIGVVQYLIYENRLYVIEVNPRASRTVPYISKVTGVPMVDIASRVMLGEKLKTLGFGTGLHETPPYFAVKVAELISSGYNELNTELVDICHMRSERQKLLFIKMQATGDDYIFIENFDGALTCPESLCIQLCERHRGIGGYGIVLMEKSTVADFRLRIFNRDGSESGMAGNSIRCAAKYLFDSGIVTKTDMTAETAGGIKKLHLLTRSGKVSLVTVEMGKAIFTPEHIPVALKGNSIIDRPTEIDGGKYRINCISLGNPHCVVFADKIESIDIERIGPLFENAPIFPERTNTEFVRVVNRNILKMRVYERGNGETNACGTGACAAVAAAIENGLCSANETVTVKTRGGDLFVKYTYDNIFLTGNAEMIFTGTTEF